MSELDSGFWTAGVGMFLLLSIIFWSDIHWLSISDLFVYIDSDSL